MNCEHFNILNILSQKISWDFQDKWCNDFSSNIECQNIEYQKPIKNKETDIQLYEFVVHELPGWCLVQFYKSDLNIERFLLEKSIVIFKIKSIIVLEDEKL